MSAREREQSVLLCSCQMSLCSALSCLFLAGLGGLQSHNQNGQFAAARHNVRLQKSWDAACRTSEPRDEDPENVEGLCWSFDRGLR